MCHPLSLERREHFTQVLELGGAVRLSHFFSFSLSPPSVIPLLYPRTVPGLSLLAPLQKKTVSFQNLSWCTSVCECVDTMA